MFKRQLSPDAPEIGGDERSKKGRRREGRGWGPFSGAQLTVVIVAVAAMFAIPTAALAASGAFTSATVTPAVMATNTSAVANAKGISGVATASNLFARYGVTGSANGANGIGVQGTGAKDGVFSNGNLGVAAGKSLSCTACVGGGALANSAKTFCGGFPHEGVDWSKPGSSIHAGCDFTGAYLNQQDMSNGNLSNAQFASASLRIASLAGANASGATFNAADLTNATLSSTNLTGADLLETVLIGAEMGDANLTGADLAFSDVADADLSFANATNADFSSAQGFNSSVVGVTWSNTTCPDHTNSDSDGGTCVGHGF